MKKRITCPINTLSLELLDNRVAVSNLTRTSFINIIIKQFLVEKEVTICFNSELQNAKSSDSTTIGFDVDDSIYNILKEHAKMVNIGLRNLVAIIIESFLYNRSSLLIELEF